MFLPRSEITKIWTTNESRIFKFGNHVAMRPIFEASFFQAAHKGPIQLIRVLGGGKVKPTSWRISSDWPYKSSEKGACLPPASGEDKLWHKYVVCSSRLNRSVSVFQTAVCLSVCLCIRRALFWEEAFFSFFFLFLHTYVKTGKARAAHKKK